MFIREIQTVNKKTGTVYLKHVLVASRLTEKGPRQHTIMQLGELDLPKDKWKQLARVLERRLSGQEASFCDPIPELEPIADRVMSNYSFVKSKQKEVSQQIANQALETIDTNSLQASKTRELGPSLIANEYWGRLGFDKVFQTCGFSERQVALAKAVVIGRLVEPGSELATWQWFRENSALPELLNEDISDLGKNPFYEISDLLWPHKNIIESLLWQNQQKLFNRRPTIFLYDLTNTYFEGMCKQNSLAQHGVSKEKRSDCRIVSLALVVDEEGTPVYSRIFKGNQSEPQTLEEILKEVYDFNRLDGNIKPTIVMDRGIATMENLKSIREKGLPYAVIERTKHEAKYIELFKNCPEGFDHHHDSKGQDVYIKKMPPENEEIHVLVKSSQRAVKERAMDSLQHVRFQNELEKLKLSISKGKPKKVEVVERRIGRIQQRFKKASKYHQIDIAKKDGYITDLTWTIKDPQEKRKDLEGSYVISTSHQELSSTQIWGLYITLTRVEDAFRSLKSDLGLRPVYHRKGDRVCAHLFISVMAYHLMSAIEKDLASRHIKTSWANVRKTMRSLQRITISYIDANRQLNEVRLNTIPEPEHKKIIDALNITNLPKRKKSIVAKLT